jgi:hypothetical protein
VVCEPETRCRRLQQAQIQARRINADVSLIKALGGDWRGGPR